MAGLLVSLATALVLLPACEQSAPAAKPWEPAEPVLERANVLLISIDTLRPDHLSCYGYNRNTSPRIDQLAAEGVLFENHISSTSWTLPAHAALFTSLPDSVHGCMDTDKRLADNRVTLAERFAAAGYQTAGFFSGPYLHPAFGLGQGFEHYQNCTSYAAALDSAPVEKWAMDGGMMKSSHHDITNPTVYAAVHAWLEQHNEKPFFLFVHMWDVHFDFIPPAPYDKRFDPDYTGTITGENFFFNPRINKDMPKRDLEHLIALYDGEIAWTDEHVGKIVDNLKAKGLLDNTVIAITADHGTEFFEHRNKGHRTTLFDELIRIPLIVRYPAGLPQNTHIDMQTRLIDVGPTLLALAGCPQASDVMGHSLVPLARRNPLDFDNVAVSELFSVGHRMRSIRNLDWKLMDVMEQQARIYFDLQADPREQRPIGDLSVGLGASLNQLYIETVRDLAKRHEAMPTRVESSDVPADVRRQLESLGYVGQQPEEPENDDRDQP